MMGCKVFLISLSVLAVAKGQGATSHIAVSRSDGQYSYDISHDHPGRSRGSSYPHGFGGFGAPGESHVAQPSYMRQNQNRNFANRHQSNYKNSISIGHQYAFHSQQHQGYPMGMLLHREHAAHQGFSPSSVQPSSGYQDENNYRNSQQGYAGYRSNQGFSDGYRGFLLTDQGNHHTMMQNTQGYDYRGMTAVHGGQGLQNQITHNFGSHNGHAISHINSNLHSVTQFRPQGSW